MTLSNEYLKRLEEEVNDFIYVGDGGDPLLLEGCALLLRLAPHINAMCQSWEPKLNDCDEFFKDAFDATQSIIEILKEQKDGS